MNHLKVIQGGMGVYISTPFLAKRCSLNGSVLGTVSGVGAEHLLARILQLGDPGGHYRRALAYFPFQEVAERIIAKYFVEGGIPAGQRFKVVPAFSLHSSAELIGLMVAASYAFVWLAKEGHTRPMSVNYLEKIQIPLICYITGAMLAGVDYVTMGAGITLQIPGVLDAIASGGIPGYRVSVGGKRDGTETISFNPHSFFGMRLPKLKRPGFLPIVSTDVLASIMTNRLPEGSIQGFVIELPTAGGHNAPPRKKGSFDGSGQPLYGLKDEVNFKKVQDLGIPFWIGGGYASPERLAQALGAVGIQAGSIFALCDDSGMEPSLRSEIRRLGYRGELAIRTDAQASPTGFPFKVAAVSGTLSDSAVYDARRRVCEPSMLRVPYRREDGTIVFRCPSEPIDDYERKGGRHEDTIGRKCLCCGLFAAAGLGNPLEPAILTMGDDVNFLRHLMKDENSSYTATDAIAYLLQTPKPHAL
jgi:NAD(P)H-dependent flavin oxidoreductase YrpB (nitropropane dioxygenase family)